MGTQPTDNYRYDAIGNLIKDSTEFIQSITWSVYGKVLKVTRDSTRMVAAHKALADLEFKYDAAGNRVMKITKYRDSTGTGKKRSPGKWTYTYYVHDASGNVMSINNQSQSDSTSIYLKELPIYGSERIGELNVSVNLTQNPKYNSYSTVTIQPEANLGKDAFTLTGGSPYTNYGLNNYIETAAFGTGMDICALNIPVLSEDCVQPLINS